MTGMPRSLFDREAIEAEIGRVRSLDLDKLRTLWRVTFRSSPSSAFTKDLMARRFPLAHLAAGLGRDHKRGHRHTGFIHHSWLCARRRRAGGADSDGRRSG